MPRKILVTGSSRGIGAAVAYAIAAAGHRVAVHAGRDAEAAERVRRGLPGDGHVVVTGDLADSEACRRVFAEAIDGLGDLDVLVNNAGVFIEQRILGTGYADWSRIWRQTIEVNLYGPANLCWLMADHLMSREAGPAGGRLISVGSRGAHRGEPAAPAYGASKAALHALTQSLAVALAPMESWRRPSHLASPTPRWPHAFSTAPRGQLFARRARSIASPRPRRSPQQLPGSRRRRRSGSAAPSSISTEPPTCAEPALHNRCCRVETARSDSGHRAAGRRRALSARFPVVHPRLYSTDP